MADRLYTVLGHTCTALEVLRGATSPGALSGATAECWRSYLGPIELTFMAAVALQASPANFRQDMIRALELDRYWRKLKQSDREKYEQNKFADERYLAERENNRRKWGDPPRWVKDGSLLGPVELPGWVKRHISGAVA